MIVNVYVTPTDNPVMIALLACPGTVVVFTTLAPEYVVTV